MKLLKIKASNFKNSFDNIEIDFLPKSKRTEKDKEYELQKIDDNLYAFNTIAFIGKNASGKTSILELIGLAYRILGDFSVSIPSYFIEKMSIEIYFYHEGKIYWYKSKLKTGDNFSNNLSFENQKLFVKKYAPTKIKEIFKEETYKEYKYSGELPEDVSILFYVLKNKTFRCIGFSSQGVNSDIYNTTFNSIRAFKLDNDLLSKIIHIFDETIQSIEKTDKDNYILLRTSGKKEIMSDTSLFNVLSSGTTKGMLLYIYVVASLTYGFDLVIDEIENHFHKTLVNNIISLYKDKNVNRKNATLIFATHYCEILDVFNRQDNIRICKNEGNIKVENMYDYKVRGELLKSKQFYNNVFKTAVNYNLLMDMKKELM